MARRKALSQTTRYEVLKRDKFTCQYCGRSSPDVVLEIDHIVPVAEGGTNDIMNLVTSCRECNRGKGKTKLTDDSAIKKQQAQLNELAERREQLEMMIKWRTELSKLDDEEIEAVENMFLSVSGHGFTDTGKRKIKSAIKKFGLNAVCDATEVYLEKYYDSDTDKFTKSFDTIPCICSNWKRQQNDPTVYWVNKVVYQANKKYPYVEKWKIKPLVEGFIKDEDRLEEMINAVYESSSWGDLKERWENIKWQLNE